MMFQWGQKMMDNLAAVPLREIHHFNQLIKLKQLSKGIMMPSKHLKLISLIKYQEIMFQMYLNIQMLSNFLNKFLNQIIM